MRSLTCLRAYAQVEYAPLYNKYGLGLVGGCTLRGKLWASVIICGAQLPGLMLCNWLLRLLPRCACNGELPGSM